jgi:hypothetical protein
MHSTPVCTLRCRAGASGARSAICRQQLLSVGAGHPPAPLPLPCGAARAARPACTASRRWRGRADARATRQNHNTKGRGARHWPLMSIPVRTYHAKRHFGRSQKRQLGTAFFALSVCPARPACLAPPSPLRQSSERARRTQNQCTQDQCLVGGARDSHVVLARSRLRWCYHASR